MYLKCSRNKVEMSEEEIFRKFRPYCAVLASQPSAECLAKLAALCDDTAAAELELVQEYLVFPAQLHLKTRAAGTPRNFTLAVLEYLRTLYKRIRLASLFILKDLLTSLALVAPGAGEDLQLSLCSTLTQLLAAARGAVAEEMADPDNGMKLPLSHLVFSEHVEQRGAPQQQPLLLRAPKGGVAEQYNSWRWVQRQTVIIIYNSTCMLL